MNGDGETETRESEPTAAQILNGLADEFREFCQARHDVGAKEYGPTKFLSNNMFRMIAEEMADISNYCMYEYIKLRLMEGTLDESSTYPTTHIDRGEGDGVSPPFASFSGAGGLSELLRQSGWLQDDGQRSSGGEPSQ